MIIFPAIDIKDGKCVRLVKGDFDTVHKVAEDAEKTALSFKKAGAKYIHMVDLDGALKGTPTNQEIFINVVKQSGLKLQLGGGIRDIKTVEYYLSNGVSRIILGSAALNNPAFLKEAITIFNDKIAVGIDAKNGNVSTHGWVKTSNVNYIDFAKNLESVGVKHIIFTDVDKDGTLQGPNLNQLDLLCNSVKIKIIASGGIHNIEDIKALKKMGVYGVICGKSIYQGTLKLEKAIEIGGKQDD